MNTIFARLLARANELADAEPLIALFLGAALLAVFLTAFFQAKPVPDTGGGFTLLWTLYRNALRVLWAIVLVLFLTTTMTVLRTYLRQTLEKFQGQHGRITQANYNAVQNIWGSEQQQRELKVDIYQNDEITERIESEDVTKPALLRKKIVHHTATGNPYVSENHTVTLRQNPRKKGSAFYDGYETDCSFQWMLRNPVDAEQNCTLVFPLPAAEAMYDGLTATLNGADVLPKMQIQDGSLVLSLNLTAGETMDFRVAFKSRGLAFWYFQVPEAREIRDFTLTLNLIDLPVAKLNYPAECMPPTNIKPTADGQGCVLTYSLGHALTNKGMGISLPQLPQPGAVTRAVLDETDRAWLLVFAMLALGLTLAGVRHAVLMTVLFSTATAFGYGLLADFSDLLFGFWGTAAFVILPLFIFLAWLLRRVGRDAGNLLAVQFLLFGLIYPCAASLDYDRQSLYLNLFSLLFLASVAWLVVRRLEVNNPPALPAQPQAV